MGFLLVQAEPSATQGYPPSKAPVTCTDYSQDPLAAAARRAGECAAGRSTVEKAGVLQALFNAEFSSGYSSMVSFMQGHLHQCPNGHCFFVIGECGGAMQESPSKLLLL